MTTSAALTVAPNSPTAWPSRAFRRSSSRTGGVWVVAVMGRRYERALALAPGGPPSPVPYRLMGERSAERAVAGSHAARGPDHPRRAGGQRSHPARHVAAGPGARRVAPGAARAAARLDGLDHQHGRPRAGRRDVDRARRAARDPQPDDVRLGLLVGGAALGRRRVR